MLSFSIIQTMKTKVGFIMYNTEYHVHTNGSSWTQTQALCHYAMLILNVLSSLLNHLPDITSEGGKDLSNLTSEDMIISHFLDLASWIVSGWQWLIALSLLPDTRARQKSHSKWPKCPRDKGWPYHKQGWEWVLCFMTTSASGCWCQRLINTPIVLSVFFFPLKESANQNKWPNAFHICICLVFTWAQTKSIHTYWWKPLLIFYLSLGLLSGKKKSGSFSIIKGGDYRKSNPKVNNSNSLLQVHIEWCSFSQQRCIKHLFYANPSEDINMNKT